MTAEWIDPSKAVTAIPADKVKKKSMKYVLIGFLQGHPNRHEEFPFASVFSLRTTQVGGTASNSITT
jgi:hypothetical protein